MQDLFSVHPDQELRATPSNWLDSATNSFAPLESQEGGLDVLLEEDEELDEYDIELSTGRKDAIHSTPQLSITPPNTPTNGGEFRHRVHTPLKSLSLDTSLANELTRVDGGMRGAQFDPVVGSPAKRFNPSSSSFSPFSHLTEFTSTYTTPDPVEKSAPRLSSNFILSGGAESRALYRRGVNARVEVEEEEEEAGSRYVLVQSLPADATRNDLENLVSGFSSAIKGIYDGRLRSHGLVVLVFYDVREALNAVACLEWDRRFKVRLDVRCILREGVDTINNHRRPNPLLSTSEGILVLSTRATNNPQFNPFAPSVPQFPLSPLALQAHLSKFGSLRSFRIIPNSSARIDRIGEQGDGEVFVVEFFDERDTERAMRAWSGLQIGGVEVLASYGVENDQYQFRTDSTSPPFINRGSGLSAMSNPFHSSSPQLPALRHAEPLASIDNTIDRREYGFARYSSIVKREGKSEFVVPPRFDTSNPRSTEIHPPAFLPPPAPISPASNSRQQRNYSPPRFASPAIPPRASSAPLATTRTVAGNEAPSYGIYRDDKIPVGNVLHLDRIEQGLEKRTTLMLKNIPNRIDAETLISLINKVVPNSFDFLYLRIDFVNRCNVGYGFINFIDSASLFKWAKTKLGQRWNVCSSEKVYVASFAAIQGKDALIAKFRNSSVMDEQRAFRPRIFYSDGPNKGLPEPFPESNDAKRKARSVANLQNIGLFPTQKPIFKVTRVVDN